MQGGGEGAWAQLKHKRMVIIAMETIILSYNMMHSKVWSCTKMFWEHNSQVINFISTVKGEKNRSDAKHDFVSFAIFLLI